MHFATFDVDGAQRTCRTQMLARATANAAFGINDRNLARAVLVGVFRHHLYGTNRAMSCAVAATYTIGHNHAIFAQPNGITN